MISNNELCATSKGSDQPAHTCNLIRAFASRLNIYTTKGALCAQSSEMVYLPIIFSTLSYSDIALIDNFDLIFFYFYFVFEIFGNNSVSIP